MVSPWWNRLDSVLFGLRRTGLALLKPHTGLDKWSEYATLMLWNDDVWSRSEIRKSDSIPIRIHHSKVDENCATSLERIFFPLFLDQSEFPTSAAKTGKLQPLPQSSRAPSDICQEFRAGVPTSQRLIVIVIDELRWNFRKTKWTSNNLGVQLLTYLSDFSSKLPRGYDWLQAGNWKGNEFFITHSKSSAKNCLFPTEQHRRIYFIG